MYLRNGEINTFYTCIGFLRRPWTWNITFLETNSRNAQSWHKLTARMASLATTQNKNKGIEKNIQAKDYEKRCSWWYQKFSFIYLTKRNSVFSPELLVEATSCLMEKRSWKTNSGPLQECKLVIDTSPPSISAKSIPLTWTARMWCSMLRALTTHTIGQV